MPIESATTIATLDISYPLGGDFTNQGDNHLRLIKSVLQLQFPGALGNGYDIPIIATEEELNWSTGLTGNIQEQFDAVNTRLDTLEAELHAPSGTRLVFNQASPPTGWTQDDTFDDAMLRVVSGLGGGSGGTDSPISHFHEGGDHVLTELEMPAHTHSYSRTTNSAARDPSGLDVFLTNVTAETGSTGGNAPHNHGDTNVYEPKYIDMIVAVAQ